MNYDEEDEWENQGSYYEKYTPPPRSKRSEAAEADDDGRPVSQEELDTAVSDLEQTMKDLGGE